MMYFFIEKIISVEKEKTRGLPLALVNIHVVRAGCGRVQAHLPLSSG